MRQVFHTLCPKTDRLTLCVAVPIHQQIRIMQHTEFIDAICSKVDNGARFMVNLEKRTLRLNGRLVDLDEVDVFRVDEAVMFRCIEDLYWQYRHSVPSERSESHRRRYFKALPEDELSDEDMMYGAARETARCRLELFILLMLRSGQLCWHEQWGSWFYQSPYEKEFIILRAWVEPKTRQTA